MKFYFRVFCLFIAITLFARVGWAASSLDVADVQQRWAVLNYGTATNQDTVEGLVALAEYAEQLANAAPDDAPMQIWAGIVLSTLADKKGGIGALGLVKRARARLERAIDIDPIALHGSAYASLGVLYHKVPGWPIGFGDKKLARQHLAKAVEIDPNGLDANFFFADFLADSSEPKRAMEYLQKALNAPELVNRPVADAGRRREAERLRAKLTDSLEL